MEPDDIAAVAILAGNCNDHTMETLGVAALSVTIGFLLFCVPLSFVNWFSRPAQRLPLATGFWALCVAGLALTTVAIVSSDADSASLAGLYSLRHVLYGVSLIAIFWVLQELSGLRQWYLFGLLIFLITVRAVLWFSTDLVGTGAVDSAGNLIYGPMRSPLGIAIGLVALITAIRSVRRPWRSNATRLLAAWVLIPAILLTTLSARLPDTVSDYLAVFLYALPVVLIQAQLLHESSIASRRSTELWRRDRLLADFGARALEVGKIVPAQAAVDLISDTLSRHCDYSEDVAGTATLVAAAGADFDAEAIARFVTPVSAQGRTVGQLIVSGDLDVDDQLYVRSVSFVLSASISRGLMEAEARDHALHNGLTGLPNWLLLKDRLTQLLIRRRTNAVTMLCIDVVDMKAINDEFGHAAGDEVLREVARRLTLLADARATVAHIGADEFAVAQIVDDRAQGVLLATRVSAMVGEPLEVDGQSITFSVRIGMALAESDLIDADRFIRDAEMALMIAKESAVPLANYDERARDEVVARRQMVRDMRDAIRNDEFFVEYQPIMELATGRTVGVEGLARWRRADGELVPPGLFIPLAEETGLIMAITRRVFTTALGQLAAWDRSGVALRELRMSLNLTPRVLDARELVPWLSELLRKDTLDPARLTLELTESALASAPSTVVSKITELRDVGLKISLDDFGTGYSTFNRLLELPVSELKIDRSFTQSIGGPHRAIVPGVIRLARDSGLAVVAEGIETAEQLAVLLADGCELGQGFLFSRPIAGSAIPAFVRSNEGTKSSLTG